MTKTLPRVSASDVAGLKRAEWTPRSADQTVAEMIDELIPALRLPLADSGGGPIAYAARRESDGQALSAAEQVLDVLDENETIVLEPDVNAG